MHRKKLFVSIIGLFLIGLIGSIVFSYNSTKHVAATDAQPIEPQAVTLPSKPAQPASTVIDRPLASTGCGQPTTPLQPGNTTIVGLTSGNAERTFRVYLPADFRNTAPHPLVMSFHGYGANSHLQEVVSQLDPVADHNNFVAVYPNGSQGKTGQRGWDTGLHKGITANDPLFVSNILNDLQANLCIKPTQIYATGFSNGGGFVDLLACTMSSRIAAFAPVSGSYVTPAQDCKPPQPVPIIEFHGTADQVNPYDGSERKHEPTVPDWLHDWRARDDCSPHDSTTSPNPNTQITSWNCADGSDITDYKIDGGQHTWPQGNFKQAMNGKLQTMQASGVIWQFFAQHPLTSI